MSAVREQKIQRAQYLMGSIFSIEITAADSKDAGAAAESAFDEMRRIEKLLSRFDAGSETYRINQAASQSPFVITSEIFHLLKLAKEYHLRTKGWFDPSLGGLDLKSNRT